MGARRPLRSDLLRNVVSVVAACRAHPANSIRMGNVSGWQVRPRIILLDVEFSDLIPAIRSVVHFLSREPRITDCIVSVGTTSGPLDFYVKRNKASVTARPCGHRAAIAKAEGTPLRAARK